MTCPGRRDEGLEHGRLYAEADAVRRERTVTVFVDAPEGCDVEQAVFRLDSAFRACFRVQGRTAAS